MKVLSISTDRKLFEENSAVMARSLEYASKMEELHIIVFSVKKLGLKEFHKNNLYIYPTNSPSKFLYIRDAILLGKKIIRERSLNPGGVITVQDPFECGKVGVGLKCFSGMPLQVQIHTDFLSPYFKNSFLNRLRVLSSGYVIRNADQIRVVSSVIFDSVKEKFANLKAEITILPIFVDAEAVKDHTEIDCRQLGADFPQRYVFMASRLSKEKRLDIALHVMKRVQEKLSDVVLIICGEGEERENIEAMAKKDGVSIKLMGWVDRAKLLQFYKFADVFLLTSEFEGYGMTLVEASVAGTPVVTTKVGLAKTGLFKSGENSFVCPVGDVDCLAKSIEELITNPEKGKLFSQKMQDSIKAVSISKEEYVSRYVGLLEKLTK